MSTRYVYVVHNIIVYARLIYRMIFILSFVMYDTAFLFNAAII